MHPLLRVLDQPSPAGGASSAHALHPVLEAAPQTSRSLPAALSLGLTALLIYGISVGLFDSPLPAGSLGALLPAARTVTILLAEPAPPRVGPEAPGGEGHREGTDTLDPRLQAFTTATSLPSDAIDPAALSTLPTADLAQLSLNPALPLQAGGNGLSHGTGRGAAVGPGGRFRPATPVPVPDFELVPTRQITLYHRLGPGEAAAAKQPVRGRLYIGADGVPLRASVVSGPEFLRAAALKAALGWRFEPLAPHGLEAPTSLTLTFYPHFL